MKALSIFGLLATFIFALLSFALFGRAILLIVLVYAVGNLVFGGISFWGAFGLGLLLHVCIPKKIFIKGREEKTYSEPKKQRGEIIDVEPIRDSNKADVEP